MHYSERKRKKKYEQWNNCVLLFVLEGDESTVVPGKIEEEEEKEWE